ncbi:hypothetical protein FRB94_012107 [Tulasnella sp. JGI-2019a]|nr:hypothetical protein FRB94_012107 [Tulasnella sp. JGI-2019a]
MGHAEVYHSSKYVPPEPTNWDAKDSIKEAASNDEGLKKPPTKVDTHADNQESPEAPGSSDAPPPFSTHNPEARVRGDLHLISHDAHLNEDGEALYRFLLEQAAIPPSYTMTCIGNHLETRTRQVLRTRGNTEQWETETYQEGVEDFAFTINLTPSIIPEPLGVPIYIVGDRTTAYRGKAVKEVDEGPHKTVDGKDLEMNQIGMGIELRRKAEDDEISAADTRSERLKNAGLPPWVRLPDEPLGAEARLESNAARLRYQYGAPGTEQTFDDDSLQSPSQNLRQWADEYCSSPKMLKEFNFHKTVYGWNLEELKNYITAICRANWTHPGNTPSITFTVSSDVVSIRPHNWLARILSHGFYKFLLCIFLIYPLIIWPYKRWGTGGGGEWRVAGAAYAMTKWVHVEDSIPGETVEAYIERVPTTTPSITYLRATPNGISRLEGIREAEWVKQWAPTIAAFVKTRRHDIKPVDAPLPRLPGTNMVALW